MEDLSNGYQKDSLPARHPYENNNRISSPINAAFDDQDPLISIINNGQGLDDSSDNESIHVQIPSSTSFSFERLFLRNCTTSDRHGLDPGQDQGQGWFTGSLMVMIFNAAVGAGILNFPKAFDEAGGILVSSSIQLIMMIFIVPALLILAYTSDFNGSKTLQDVLTFSWGKAGQRFTSLCVAVYCFGTCITFMIIIGDQFDRVFASIYGPTFCHEWYMNRSFTISITSILFILPFCFPKKIDFLRHISSLGVISVIYVALLIIYQYYCGGYEPGEIKVKPDHWTDVFLVIPTICFGYQCHVSVIPIYSCYRERSMKKFTASTSLAIILCIFTYTISATFGYLTFGSKITSDILTSYSNAKDPTVLIAIIAIAIKSYTTYPLLLFCGREGASNLWLDLSISFGCTFEDNPRDERFRRITIASIWFVLTLILALLLPNIGSVIKLLGSLASIFIFVFPGLCLLKLAFLMEDRENYEFEGFLTTKRKTHLLTFSSGLFLFVGFFLFGCVLTQAILYDFVYESAAEIPLCQWTVLKNTYSPSSYSFLDSVHLYKNLTHLIL